MNKPVLIVIAGPNGSGKTTITKRVVKHEWAERCEYINPDEVAQNVFGNWNDTNAIKKAIDYCENRRQQCLTNHQDFIFETVLSTDEKIDFLFRAKKEGYFIRVFYVCTQTPAINAMRVAKRVMEGGHDVPIQKIISRYQKSIVNIVKVLQFADRTYFYDNSVDNQDAQLLFRTSNGILTKQYTAPLPDWALPIYNNTTKP